MSTTKYANAVAAVKAMENDLLTRSDLDQLINASAKSEIDSLLSAKRSGAAMTLEGVWEMIRGYAPDCRELEILLYRNDFHNLKATLKCLIAGREPEGLYIRPTNLDLAALYSRLSAKEYDELPAYIRNTAQDAYELLTRTLDGQLAESIIDAAALKEMQRAADEFGGSFIKRYAELTCACCDIKTAWRCAAMNKQRNFLEMAVCGSRELDKDSIISASLGGKEAIISYLENTSYSEAGKLLSTSEAQFEKWCDDIIMELAEGARMQAFGSEPLAAYYIAAEAELKNLRIITVCKESGSDRDTITERMRKLYV